jgi:D-inositol-3-phosphate glycosyltransferase
MAKVKNLSLAEKDRPEPAARVIGETQVVEAADRLVANTDDEASELMTLYGADPEQVVTVAPGVDLEVFCPADQAGARSRLGLAADALVLLFVGRIQPLKAPDVLLKAAARMLAADPALRSRLVVAVVGGPSGGGVEDPECLQEMAGRLGISDVMRFEPPVPREVLPDWYRAADITVVPSYSESFGLVAIESQACGTPVVASAVGGLSTAVADGGSGVLVDGHDPADYARVLGGLLADQPRRAALGRGALLHAARFGWAATATGMLEVYAGAIADARLDLGTQYASVAR